MSFKDDFSLEFNRLSKANADDWVSEKLCDAEFIQMRYTDLGGRFRAKYLACEDEEAFLRSHHKSGISVDGSSVSGLTTIDESDLLLVPDISTMCRIPPKFFLNRDNVAMLIADIYWGFEMGRLSNDPRYVTQKTEEHLREKGLVCQIGPEVECFIFDEIAYGRGREKNQGSDKGVIKNDWNDSDASVSAGLSIKSVEDFGFGKYPIRRKDGYDAPPFQDSLLEIRFEIAKILKDYYLIKPTNLNHEVASSGQIEINFIHSTLTKAADNVQVYKDVVRTVAKQHSKVANFMPKPIFDEADLRSGHANDNGSGMHVSVSLWRSNSASIENSDSNLFYDPDDEYAELSQEGRYFIGGLLDHASSLALIVTPTVNSYYRMVPGFEAPVYSAWSRGNRSAVIRVPINDKKEAKSKRVEFRAPDPSANPYLAFSAILAAGLDGMRRKIDPGDPVNENIYKMTESKRQTLGIRSLPGSLQEALESFCSDNDYLKADFGEKLKESYLSLKRAEIKSMEGNRARVAQFMFYYDV